MVNPWPRRLQSTVSDPARLGLWAGTNLLNVADALLTHGVVSQGLAREGNPVVNAIGLPAKVAGVACISAIVAIVLPRALWIPIAALGAVVVYTLGGLLFA